MCTIEALMETESAKRRKLMNEGLKHDRISDLPDLLHSILHLVPFKSAAQTVVLSRRWRNVFSSLPDLDFTRIPSPLDEVIIEHVLSHRDNNSSIGTLKLASSLSSTILNCLMKCARINHIHELDVNVSSIQNFPWDILVHCGSLKVLRLDSMYLNVNPTMNHRFKSLHTIILSNIFS